MPSPSANVISLKMYPRLTTMRMLWRKILYNITYCSRRASRMSTMLPPTLDLLWKRASLNIVTTTMNRMCGHLLDPPCFEPKNCHVQMGYIINRDSFSRAAHKLAIYLCPDQMNTVTSNYLPDLFLMVSCGLRGGVTVDIPVCSLV